MKTGSSTPPVANKAFKGELSGRKLFVIGDSHAAAYNTMLTQLEDEHGIEVHLYFKGGCAPAQLLKPLNSGCVQFIKETLDEVLRLSSPGDMVFLPSLRMNRFADQWETFDEASVIARQIRDNTPENRAKILRETSELLSRLEKKSLYVLIDAPKPVFKSPPFRCADWFNSNNPVCLYGFTMKRDFLLSQRKPVMDLLESLARMHPDLIVWDPFPILCPEEVCSAFDEGGPLFFDGDHLTAHGNRVLYPSFELILRKIYKL